MNIEDREQDGKEARSFMSGVLLLSFSTVAVKIVGFAFKIPMLSFLGTEGMGYFNSAYEIYALLCIIATAGLPVALSMTVSAARARYDREGVARAYRAAKLIFFLIGVTGSVSMILFSEKLALFIGNPDAYLCIVAIAPALFTVCMSSALRGYCQGFGNMMPTALSQLIEALGKLIFGVSFAAYAIKKGYGLWVSSAFAVLGISVGSLIALIYLTVAKNSKGMRKEQKALTATVKRDKRAHGVGEIVAIALPITLGAALLGLTRIADMTIIMRQLQNTGVSVEQSNRIYGAYTTLAIPVFSLIPSLIAPISMALVPQLAAFIQRKDELGEATVINNSVRLTVLLAMPASMGLSLFSRPVLELLFSAQSEAVDICAPLLSVLGASVLFSCLITTTNAILQSYKKVALPIISMSVGLAVKIVATYLLVGTEGVGVIGAPIGSLLCNLVVTVMNICFMCANARCEMRASTLLFKPFLVSFLSVGTAFVAFVYIDRRVDGTVIPFGTALMIAITLYALLSIAVGSVTKKDIMLLPLGDRAVAAFEKIKRKSKNL